MVGDGRNLGRCTMVGDGPPPPTPPAPPAGDLDGSKLRARRLTVPKLAQG